MVNTIINNIIYNDKRMAKLSTIKRRYVYDKARQYVVGEAATLKVRLTDDEATKAVVQIVAAIERRKHNV